MTDLTWRMMNKEIEYDSQFDGLHTGWVEIAHTEEGKTEDSAACCGIGVSNWNTLNWRSL